MFRLSAALPLCLIMVLASACRSIPEGAVSEAESLLAQADSSSRPPLFAHYYTWYATEYGPHGKWVSWGSRERGLLAPNATDPARVLPSGEREIAGMNYPLVGPYDSTDAEVVRWHIQLAQAAGIDAFLVDWWGTGSWQDVPGLTYQAFAEAVLPVAEEEGFKVFLFDELPQFHDDLNQVMEWAAEFLARFSQSPAYLHIDGKPAYALYQFWEGRMTPEEATRFKDHVEARVGPVYWIVDKVRARPVDPYDKEGPYEFFVPDEWLGLEWIDCFMSYGTFHNIRIYEYDELAPRFEKLVKEVQGAGHKILLPLHPGHDNSRISLEPWVMPRRDGETLRGYLRAATEAGADFVAVTSFNEWPETTVIEPSSSWPEPYFYLRLLASWKGMEFRPPEEMPARRGQP